ncbi:PrnB family protein [Porticoccus sp.]
MYQVLLSQLQGSIVKRGLLPEPDPLTRFPTGSPYEMLDDVGRRLPQLLNQPGAREYLKGCHFPEFDAADCQAVDAELRLYYVRLGFIASGYINQIGQPPCHSLPANIAVPLVKACERLERPPILSYDGYALYNWCRLDPNGPIALGNIDTLQNFVELYDEHWFILVHVEIEVLAAEIFRALVPVLNNWCAETINAALWQIAHCLEKQLQVLRRIPEHMSPELYFRAFRPYIRFFEDVSYEGVNQVPLSQRGETGAQSSIIPSLVALLKIPHKPTALTNHLRDMRHYMPAGHRLIIEELERLTPLNSLAEPEPFNAVLENLALFREQHLRWAESYINAHVSDPRGTGGTPYMQWLQQLIDETRAYQR